jgi:hypothetical protein
MRRVRCDLSHNKTLSVSPQTIVLTQYISLKLYESEPAVRSLLSVTWRGLRSLAQGRVDFLEERDSGEWLR